MICILQLFLSNSGGTNSEPYHDDRRVMTPAYRRKFNKQSQLSNAAVNIDGSKPILQHNGPIFLTSGGEDEVQERFHADRERNLKSFFQDGHEHLFNDVPTRNEFRGNN